jgi:hypothetical protein
VIGCPAVADQWWTNLVVGLVGVAAGALLSRHLADRSERQKQLHQAYVAWLVSMMGYREGSMDQASNEAAYRALLTTRWTLELLEPDPERLKVVREITGHAYRRDYVDVYERLESFMPDLRRSFTEKLDV